MNEWADYYHAQSELAALADTEQEREGRILSRLVASYEAGTLTAEQARDGIVAIAALRALVRDIDKRFRLAGAAITAKGEHHVGTHDQPRT